MSLPVTPTHEGFAELLRLARGGSVDALGQLLDQYRPFLHRVANEELNADLQAKAGGSDLVQQSFLEASVGFEQFQGNSPDEWLDWLARILRNNAHDLRRQYRETDKRAVRREVAADATAAFASQHVAAGSSPSEHVVRQERAQALVEALQRLSASQREVIRLRQQDELTFGEIGRRMGCTEEAARKQWGRAIEELRDLLRGIHGSSS